MRCLHGTAAARPGLPRSTPCRSTRQRLRPRPARAFGPEAEIVEGIEKDTRVRIKAPVTVFHSAKLGAFDLEGKEGVVLDVVRFYKGKELSATLPYKVQIMVPQGEGKDVKLLTHLAGGELEKVE